MRNKPKGGRTSVFAYVPGRCCESALRTAAALVYSRYRRRVPLSIVSTGSVVSAYTQMLIERLTGWLADFLTAVRDSKRGTSRSIYIPDTYA